MMFLLNIILDSSFPLLLLVVVDDKIENIHIHPPISKTNVAN